MTDYLASADLALLKRHGLDDFEALWALQLEAVDLAELVQEVALAALPNRPVALDLARYWSKEYQRGPAGPRAWGWIGGCTIWATCWRPGAGCLRISPRHWACIVVPLNGATPSR